MTIRIFRIFPSHAVLDISYIIYMKVEETEGNGRIFTMFPPNGTFQHHSNILPELDKEQLEAFRFWSCFGILKISHDHNFIKIYPLVGTVRKISKNTAFEDFFHIQFSVSDVKSVGDWWKKFVKCSSGDKTRRGGEKNIFLKHKKISKFLLNFQKMDTMTKLGERRRKI